MNTAGSRQILAALGGPSVAGGEQRGNAHLSSAYALAATVRRLTERLGVIEIDLPDGVRVRVDSGVNEEALRRMLSAVRGLG